MAYNAKSIIKDVNGKPVPQYWNKNTQKYEVVQGSNNCLNVNMVDVNGNQIQSQSSVDQISAKIDELIRVVK